MILPMVEGYLMPSYRSIRLKTSYPGNFYAMLGIPSGKIGVMLGMTQSLGIAGDMYLFGRERVAYSVIHDGRDFATTYGYSCRQGIDFRFYASLFALPVPVVTL